MLTQGHRERSKIIAPPSGYGGAQPEVAAEIEIRVDPLTGHRCRINLSRDQRPKQPMGGEVAVAAGKCPFCPENIEASTPTFPPDLIAGGRMRHGGAVLFPNLYPLSEMHGVCVFTPLHKVKLSEFAAGELFDGLKCCIEFIKKCRSLGINSHLIGWNHLSQAGASMTHPHFQAIASREEFESIRNLLDLSRAFHSRRGLSFWRQLVLGERESPRWIGSTDGFDWFAPWAPMGSYEVMGACSAHKGSIDELEDSEIEGLAEGVANVISGYWDIGMPSLNLAIFSSGQKGAGGYFSLHARILARPRAPISDRAFLELYGGEVGISVPPEQYAGRIRSKF